MHSIIFFFLSVLLIVVAQTAQPPCIPTHGKTALIIGQDFASIGNYTTAGFGHSKPFGLMSYTSLRSLAGLTEATNYGSGIQWASGLTETYPGSAIQIGLWIVGDSKSIVVGEYDEAILNLISYLNGTTSVYYLRIGYEFDSLSNNYPTAMYKKAFQYIVTKFRNSSVDNVSFVWHASGFQPRDGYKHLDWFPGVEYVDWCGVSLFQQPYKASHMRYADQFADLCKSLGLPLMIAESTPFGGILDESTVRSHPGASNRAGYQDSTWSRWFVPVLAFIQRHDVRIWSYINCDWDQQPMWAKFHAPGVYWGDSRIEGAWDIFIRRLESPLICCHNIHPILDVCSILFLLMQYANYLCTAHEDTLARWKVDVLSSSRFIESYETVHKENLCQNLPHSNTHYFAYKSYLWQLSALIPIILLVVLVDYFCLMKPDVDHNDVPYHHS